VILAVSSVSNGTAVVIILLAVVFVLIFATGGKR
jgi:hypothetical protein